MLMGLLRGRGLATSKILRSSRIRPLSRSMQRTDRILPSSVAVVSQTCFPQITGEDQARP